MLKIFVLCAAFIASEVTANPVNGDLTSYRKRESDLFRKIFTPESDDYDKGVRPPGPENPDDPLTITTSLYINDLHFCGKRQALNVGGYFRQKWVDRRLIASTKEDEKDLIIKQFPDMFENGKIWIPDVFVPGSIKGYVNEGPSRSFLRLKADGSVASSFRLKAEVSCPYDGEQAEVECNMSLESYGYASGDIIYKWDENETLQISDAAKSHVVNNGWEIYETAQKNQLIPTSTGKYNSVSVTFKLRKV